MEKIFYVISITILILSGTAYAQDYGTGIQVPSDPKARYWIVEGQRTTTTIVEILTHREGPSGTSFALRQIDCDKHLFRYLGEGDTLAEAKANKYITNMGPLVPNSISTYIADFACANFR